jgi:tetratricopeptide (TPR) repeat protein
VAQAEDLKVAFAQANKLYEESQFTEAVAAYQKLVDLGHVSAALYFNLGNAYFKSGQAGRAIAAYRRAEELTPRDPDLQANLQFVRRLANGGTPPKSVFWRRWLASLTLNEWAWLSAGIGWVWFLLLTVRQLWIKLRKRLARYTMVAGVGFAAVLACTALVFTDKTRTASGVVIVPEAVVRYGPLTESPQFYQLRDGAEVRVLDQDREWVQVIDPATRKGWLLREQVLTSLPARAP